MSLKNDPLTIEQHLLCCLAEEAAEVIQAVNKALRFGLDDDYKGPGADSPSNLNPPREYIVNEIADFIAVLKMLQARQTLSAVSRDRVNGKKIKVQRFMEYAIEQGTLRK